MAVSFELICIWTNERWPDRNMGFGQVDLAIFMAKYSRLKMRTWKGSYFEIFTAPAASPRSWLNRGLAFRVNSLKLPSIVNRIYGDQSLSLNVSNLNFPSGIREECEIRMAYARQFYMRSWK
jgi:hypothetical protein